MPDMQVEGVEYGAAEGSYDGNVKSWRDASGNLMLKDVANAAGVALSDLLASVGGHSITQHTDLESDFAEQYYNSGRLAAYLADAGTPPVLATAVGVAGHATVAEHVQDEEIHQRTPKFMLRVSKGGTGYGSIFAALQAIPTDGPDVPAAGQWWCIEVAPGTYAEHVVVERSYVSIRGTGGREATRVETSDGAFEVSAPHVLVEGMAFINSEASVNAQITALEIGTGVTDATIRDCTFVAAGKWTVEVATGTERLLLDGCRIEAAHGAAMLIMGPVEMDRCTLVTASLSESHAVFVDQVPAGGSAEAQVVLRRCRAEGAPTYLLGVKSSRVRVEDLICRDNLILATSVAGNVASTVEWARLAAVAEGHAAEGTITLSQVRDGGLSTRGSVLVDWLSTDRSFRSGIGAGGAPVGLVGAFSQSDHHLIRYIVGGTPGGDVQEVEDKSTAGDTSAVKWTLGASTGRFARWVSKVGGVETELGYIGRDGVVHAPGFVSGGAAVGRTLYVATADVSGVDTDTNVTLGSYSLPVGTLTAGRVIRVRASGIVYNSSGNFTEAAFSVHLGSLVLGTILAVHMVDDGTAQGWFLTADFVVRSAGVSGSAIGGGTINCFDGFDYMRGAMAFIPGSATINTTATQAVAVKAQMSHASVDTYITLHTFTVEAL